MANTNKGYINHDNKYDKKFLVLTNSHIYTMLKKRSERENKSVNRLINEIFKSFFKKQKLIMIDF